MSAQHTPGPWFVDKIQDRNAYNIFPHGATHALLTVSGPVHDGAHRYALEAEANARLIAAAPELLEALDGMLQVYGGNRSFDGLPKHATELDLISQARAAIAKATGGAA